MSNFTNRASDGFRVGSVIRVNPGPRRKSKKREVGLGVENLEARQLLTGDIAIHGTITANTSYNDTTVLYVVDKPLTVAAGVTVKFGPNTKVKIDPNQSILDKGTIITGAGSQISQASSGSSTTVIEVTKNAKLQAVNTLFNFANAPDPYESPDSSIEIDAGGKLTAAGSTFAINEVTIKPGATLNGTDLTNNTFNTTLEIPSTGIAKIANNVIFHDIDINDAGPTASQTIALNAIGASTTSSALRYLFTTNFTVQPGVTLAVAPNVNVVIDNEVTLTDKGTINTASHSQFLFDDQADDFDDFSGAEAGLEIVDGGIMTAVGSVFNAYQPNYYGEYDEYVTALNIDQGGKFSSTGSTFSIGSVVYAAGTSPAVGDLTNNVFNANLSIPSTSIAAITNNQHFHKILFTDSGQNDPPNVALNQIGTDGDFSSLEYVFSSNFTIGSGITLTVGDNVEVAIPPYASLTISGTMTTGTKSTVNFDYDDNNDYGQSSLLEIAQGGTLNAEGTLFASASGGDYPDSGSDLAVDQGASFTSTGSTFELAKISFDPTAILASSDFTGNTFDATLSIPSTSLAQLSNNRVFNEIDLDDQGPTAPQTISLGQIGTNGDFSSLVYKFTTNFTVATGVTLAIGQNIKVALIDYSSLLIQGTVTAASQSEIDTFDDYDNQSDIIVQSQGTLSLNGATIEDPYGDDTYYSQGYTALAVDSGGRLLATGSTFRLNKVSIDPSVVIQSGDLTNNIFNTSLAIPSTAIPLVLNNQRFQDIDINDPGPTGAPTIALNPIGTLGDFSQLRYVFTKPFTVQRGVTLAVASNVQVAVQANSFILDKGTITSAANSKFAFLTDYETKSYLKVMAGGIVNAKGTVFTAATDPDHYSYDATTAIDVDAGGTFMASSSRFAVDNLTFSPQAVIKSGDLTNNLFQTTLTLPSSSLASIASNKSFHDIAIDDILLPATQSLSLQTIGTAGDFSQLRYVFASSFTIAPGALVSIYPNVPVVINPGVKIIDQGTITGVSGALTFAGDDTSSSGLEIASGGKLVLSNTLIGNDSAASGSFQSKLQVDAGGSMVSMNSHLSPSAIILFTGSTGNFASNSLDTKLTLSSGSGVVIQGNTIDSDSLVNAGGPATAQIDLIGNDWGVPNPATIIYDHADDPTLPTVNFNPTLTSPNASGAFTTIQAMGITTSFSKSTQAVNLTAQVNGPTLINEGTVTFTILTGSRIVGSPVTVNVVNGVAQSGSFYLPSALQGGNYGIRAVYNGTSHFLGSIDEAAKLKVLGALTTTAASSGWTDIAAGSSLPLSAVVTSPLGIVNQGSVSFTLMKGSNVIGTPILGVVVNGVALVNYPIPLGTPSGSYTLQAVFGTASNFLGSSGSVAGIVVVAASTTTTAALPSSLIYSTSDESIALSANVTSSSGVVNEGTETFTILIGNLVIGAPVTVNVVNGVASTSSYLIPKGTAAIGYTLLATYQGTTNFGGSADSSKTLTITEGSTVTVGVSVAGNLGRSVILTANVNSSSGVVNEGTETFTIFNGSAPIGSPITVKVINGKAAASFAVPSGTTLGQYSIHALYNGTLNLKKSADQTKTLTLVTAASTTNMVAAAAQTGYSEAAQAVTLATTITSTAGLVNGGTVTFTILKGSTVIGTATTSAQVINGVASVSYSLPMGLAVGGYTVKAVYNGNPYFLASTDSSQTLSVNKAAATVVANNATSTTSPIAQSITLSAAVTTHGVNLSQGSVLFKIYKSNGINRIASSAATAVVNGFVSANLTLPANLAAGTYLIVAIYTDSAGNYQAFTDSTHKLVLA